MKFRTLFLLVCAAFLLVACAPPAVAANLQNLPDEGSLLIFTLVSAGVTWLLLKLSEKTGFDFGGYANAIAAAVAPILVALVESWLQVIPPIFDNIVLTVIHLIVLLVGSIGTFFLFKRKAPSLRG